jgi:CTP:molybdopterin cytidylyltransferase MocA
VTTNARDVMHAHQDRVRYVTVEDDNTIRNVNTPEEYAALLG